MHGIKYLSFLLLFTLSCGQGESNQPSLEKDNSSPIENGKWKFSFLTQKHEIPIRVIIENDSLFFYNAAETIPLKLIIKKDSFYIDIPNYDSHIEGLIQYPTILKGVYIKDYAEDYSIPFLAERNDENVFGISSNSNTELKNKYEVKINNKGKISPAIGLFHQNGNIVTGSFATETGDYRFLEGVIEDNKLKLSTFDGSHLYLFTADIKEDSLVNGIFISGKGGNYTWSGNYSEKVELRDPEKLTYLKDDSKPFDFSLLDLEQNPISLNDDSFKGKIKIIQIMGTWCPNCLDETRYFNSIYPLYKDRGLEIIAVAFENGNDTTQVLEKLKRYKKNNKIEFTLLYGGKAGSSNASEVFPMLTKIMSFPTAIYLDKDNKVVKIYTGFYGPGTGRYYKEYTEKTEAFINSLLD